MNLKTKELIWGDSPHRALIQIVGYKGLPTGEVREKVKQLGGQFTEKALNDAFLVVLTVEAQEPFMARLLPEIRRIAWPILGPDPEDMPWWAKDEKPQAVAPPPEPTAVAEPPPEVPPEKPTKRKRKGKAEP
jgi:hypothetical protein